jgi:hypothetical protein
MQTTCKERFSALAAGAGVAARANCGRASSKTQGVEGQQMKKRFRLRTFAGLTTLAALAALVTMILAGGASAIVAGAGFTTNNPAVDSALGTPDTPVRTCFNGSSVGLPTEDPSVNCNLYGSKDYAWINGGPSAGQNKLTDGIYFFAVVEPSGQNDPNDGGANNLSDTNTAGGSPTANCQVTNPADPPIPATIAGTGCGDAYTNRLFTVSNGKISAYSGTHVKSDAYLSTRGLMINLAYYDDTSNPGGVYILAICRTDTTDGATAGYPVAPSSCKYDAFKAPKAGTPPCTTNCTPSLFGVVSGAKYYDRNQNGKWDNTGSTAEPAIPGWAIDYADGDHGTLYTDGSGQFSVSLLADTYTFAEEHPSATYPNWLQTGNDITKGSDRNQTVVTPLNIAGASATLNADKTYTLGVVDDSTISGVYFGNVCRVSFRSAARTMGYWANNGNSSITAADITSLQAIALVAADNGTLLNLSSTLSVAQGQIKTLINGAASTNAKNMAFMLSGQLIALVLNVNHGFLIGTDIYTPDGRTFSQIIADATAALLGHNNTQSKSTSDPGGTYRTLQGSIKNLIDTINNTNGQNLTVVPYDLAGTYGAFARCGAPSAMFPQS